MAPKPAREKAAAEKEVTPERPPTTVRRSVRIKLGPERLSYSPQREETHDIKKQKVQKNHKHNPSILQQTMKDEEDGKNVDQIGVYGQLSEYELKRLETIREPSLSVFHQLTWGKRRNEAVGHRCGGLARSATVKELPPARKSLRLQNKEAEVKPASQPKVAAPQTPLVTKFYGPQPINPINTEESKLPLQLLELSFEDLKEDRKVELDLERYCSTLQKMKINEDQVAKVVTNRIYCAAFHPSCSSLFMTAGDTMGNVGLWGLSSDWGDDSVLLFKPHARCVSCMAFSRACSVQLLSGSYDGSLRVMDLEKGVFDDVYDFDDGLKTFDFMSHDCLTLVVGSFYGDIAIVDRHTPGNSHESLHSLNTKALRCLNVHTVHKQYLLVAENKIFDTSESTAKPPLLTSIRHNTHTGRWLSKISAVWDPKPEDCFCGREHVEAPKVASVP